MDLIAATTAQAGLKVLAEPDESRYETAVKPSPEQIASIKMTRSDFHGEWNYTIHPDD